MSLPTLIKSEQDDTTKNLWVFLYRFIKFFTSNPNSAALIFYCCCDKHYKLCGLKPQIYYINTSVNQKSAVALSGLRCLRGCISWRLRGESIFLLFPASRGHGLSLPMVLSSIFKANNMGPILKLLSPRLPLPPLRTLVIPGAHPDHPGWRLNSICDLNSPLPCNLTYLQVSGIPM